MFQRKWFAPLLALLMVASVAMPGAAAMTRDRPTQQTTSGYAGSHVEFQTTGSSIANYTVNGAGVAESIRVQTQETARSDAGVDIGVDVSALTSWTGASLAVDARTDTQASVTSESGATLTAHDNGHGSLVVDTGGESQYVGMNLSESATVESDSEQRAVVTTSEGSTATVLVAGEGSVAVNNDGNLTAELDADDRVVIRTYDGARTEEDKQQENLITSGTAAAQVYLTEDGDDVVDYGQNTSVEVQQHAEGTVEMTVDRSASQGKVVITSVSDTAIQTTDNLDVRVDGEAAAQASSYSELETAANGGETSKYMVHSSSTAEASADVLVGINHFSERSVTMEEQGSQETNGGDSNTGDGDETPGSSGPGFGMIITALALVSVAVIAGYRVREN